MKRRVAVTGIGCVSPFGVGVDTLWNNLKNGISGVRYLSLDKEKHIVHIGGQVPEFDTSKYVDDKDARRMDNQLHTFRIADFDICIRFADGRNNMLLLPSFRPFVSEGVSDDSNILFRLTVDDQTRPVERERRKRK
jgi:hypothetical protein